MQGFTIEYHRPTGVARVHEFLGPQGHREATLLRLKLEKERVDLDWEIVALASDSLETVKKTHSRYFAENDRSDAARIRDAVA